ncbi:MAG: DUF1501 domain-containing protein, partial [Planctomycetes bacterium]|nr:DUF1501 domain-containing protein [Planctomycetota bacterium]
MNPRRDFLRRSSCGFGALAAMGLIQSEQLHAACTPSTSNRLPGLHHPAKAKRVIFLFMQGGVSQVDSFDRKPILEERDGEMVSFDDPREFANTRKLGSPQRIMKSPWTFKQYGESGRWVSDLFPRMAEHVDKMAFVHSMHTDGVAHGPATLFLHCGAMNVVRPSMGSWTIYGLGSENENLPGFISIAPSIGNGGARNYGAAFLPAKFQGTPIGNAGKTELRIEHISAANSVGAIEPTVRWQLQAELQRLQMQKRLAGIDPTHNSAPLPDRDELDSLIASYELAARMQ